MYYNAKTKETKSKYELKNLLHASIPESAQVIGDWYKLPNQVEYPEGFDANTQRIKGTKIVKSGSSYIQVYEVENIPEEELTAMKLSSIHDECDDKLNRTDYLMNTDYDGTGSNNINYMNAVKSARSTWRRLRQTDIVTNETIPDIPMIQNF